MQSIEVKRAKHRLLADARRVIAKPYLPGEDGVATGDSRAGMLIKRIMAIPEPSPSMAPKPR